ncbi:MAG TPA: hypothetical protein VLT58_17545, partial [Polyangia bacterium]|nr:hypothetical protein [Polyangia bacterium]
MPDGGVVFTGVFTRDALFGSTTLTSSGGRDLFVARYANDGTLLWAVEAGGQLDDEGSAIAALSDGSIAVAGYFSGTAVFGRGTAHEVSLTSPGPPGQIDLFVARYTPDGDVLWAQEAGGNSQEFALGLAARPDGGVVLMADVMSDSGFSGFLSTHAPGIALASFTALGDLAWDHSFATDEPAWPRGCLSVGPDGTTLFCGYSRAAVSLWTGSVSPLSLPAPDPIGFVGAVGGSGLLSWATHAR